MKFKNVIYPAVFVKWLFLFSHFFAFFVRFFFLFCFLVFTRFCIFRKFLENVDKVEQDPL